MLKIFEKERSSAFIDDGLDLRTAVARYKRRRQALMHSYDQLIILKGCEKPAGSEHIWAHCDTPLYQDPNILYLTGLNQLNVALILNPISGKEILFLPFFDAKKEFWEGSFFTFNIDNTAECARFLGVDSIKPISKLKKSIVEQLEESKQSQCSLFWYKDVSKSNVIRDSHHRFKMDLQRYFKRKKMVIVLNNIQDKLEKRCCLDAHDIHNLKQANNLTASIL